MAFICCWVISKIIYNAGWKKKEEGKLRITLETWNTSNFLFLNYLSLFPGTLSDLRTRSNLFAGYCEFYCKPSCIYMEDYLSIPVSRRTRCVDMDQGKAKLNVNFKLWRNRQWLLNASHKKFACCLFLYLKPLNSECNFVLFKLTNGKTICFCPRQNKIFNFE